jgi:hypothetical protein
MPDNVTALTQRFPIRWGAFRMFISTAGVRSSGIAAVTVRCARLCARTVVGYSVALALRKSRMRSQNALLLFNSRNNSQKSWAQRMRAPTHFYQVGGKSLDTTSFNATAIVLTYTAMPAPSAAATAATDSDISTAADDVDVVITFKDAGDNGEHNRVRMLHTHTHTHT